LLILPFNACRSAGFAGSLAGDGPHFQAILQENRLISEHPEIAKHSTTAILSRYLRYQSGCRPIEYRGRSYQIRSALTVYGQLTRTMNRLHSKPARIITEPYLDTKFHKISKIPRLWMENNTIVGMIRTSFANSKSLSSVGQRRAL
jgi:hypothetical protein